MNDDMERKVTRAKTQLALHHPFYAIIALSLEMVNVEGTGMERAIPTMATDGRRIYWNPKFVSELSDAEVLGVICHEVLHVAWLHMLRRGNRDQFLWNVACDHAINWVVTDGKLELPKGKWQGHQDPKYKDWPADEIYEDLLKNPPKKIKITIMGSNGEPQSNGDDDGEEMWGVVLDAQGEDGKALSDSELAEMEEEIKITIKKAAENAKAVGKLPAAMNGLIEAVGKPKINWKDYIQSWVSGRIPDNYTWRRPNRKLMSQYGIYMPSMELNGAGVGVLSIDMSGSVSDNELQTYVREITGLIELCNPSKLYIFQHDTMVHRVDEWESGDDFSHLTVSCRGGTSIRPSFQKALELDEEVNWMICFTDMEICDFPSETEAPDFPVLWAATGPDCAPFGTYLSLKDAM